MHLQKISPIVHRMFTEVSTSTKCSRTVVPPFREADGEICENTGLLLRVGKRGKNVRWDLEGCVGKSILVMSLL